MIQSCKCSCELLIYFIIIDESMLQVFLKRMNMRLLVIGLLVFSSSGCFCASVPADSDVANLTQNHKNDSSDGNKHEEHTIHLATLRWSYVSTPFVLTTFVLCTGLLKIVYHHADKLSSLIPESCILILLGVIVAFIARPIISYDFLPHFTTNTFFLFLLPPIVLEAAYSLHDRAFFRNIGTILLYAVVGTLLNCFIIGPCLYGFGMIGGSELKISLVNALVFSALIAAVDPVAVLAIFQEIGVNKDLYFLVFGESLLNDAVTIVLYTMMEAFTKMPIITAGQCGLGMVAFLTVSLGGLLIGAFIGVVTAVVTKHTENVRVVEPLAFLGLAYFSYLLAELFHFSGIISITGCGLVQAHYAIKNISSKSYTTIKYFAKMLSGVADSIIFLFLGMVLVHTNHVWHTSFVLTSLVLCIITRFFSVYFLTYIANRFRSARINFEEQMIMAFGGLRGAVAFSLVLLVDGNSVKEKPIFVTTTLVIVIFTVFIQGTTVKPLVKILRIRQNKGKELSLFTEINHKLMGHLMAGIEEISGNLGDFHVKARFTYLNNKYVKPYLIRHTDEGGLNRLYEKLTLADHYANLYGPNLALEDNKHLITTLNDKDEHPQMVSNIRPERNEADLEAQVRQPSKWGKLRDRFIGGGSVSSGGDADHVHLPVGREISHAEITRVLSSNPYEKLHHTYNPNLVDDEEQEFETHLRRRCSKAKKLTNILLTPQYDAKNPDSTVSDSAVEPDLRQSSLPSRKLTMYNVTQLLMNRAAESKRRARSLSDNEQPVFSVQTNPAYSHMIITNESTNSEVKEEPDKEDKATNGHKPMRDNDELPSQKPGDSSTNEHTDETSL